MKMSKEGPWGVSSGPPERARTGRERGAVHADPRKAAEFRAESAGRATGELATVC